MKRFVLLSLAVIGCLMMVQAQNTNPKSGKCGNDIEWSFDGRTLYVPTLTCPRILRHGSR